MQLKDKRKFLLLAFMLATGGVSAVRLGLAVTLGVALAPMAAHADGADGGGNSPGGGGNSPGGGGEGGGEGGGSEGGGEGGEGGDDDDVNLPGPPPAKPPAPPPPSGWTDSQTQQQVNIGPVPAPPPPSGQDQLNGAFGTLSNADNKNVGIQGLAGALNAHQADVGNTSGDPAAGVATATRGIDGQTAPPSAPDGSGDTSTPTGQRAALGYAGNGTSSNPSVNAANNMAGGSTNPGSTDSGSDAGDSSSSSGAGGSSSGGSGASCGAHTCFQ